MLIPLTHTLQELQDKLELASQRQDLSINAYQELPRVIQLQLLLRKPFKPLVQLKLDSMYTLTS